MKKMFFLLLFLTIARTASVTAQITIGANQIPHDFSILELTGSNRGLRLPQLTTAECNAWRDYFLGTATGNPVKPSETGITADELVNAPGLAIFNTDTKCYEYWNASRWVSLCEGNSLMTVSPDPCQNVAADGTGCDLEFTVTDPDCPNGPFTIMIIAGQDYAQLTGVNETDGIFKLSFQPNNSINRRSVVVRVTGSCTGLYKDFLFLQDGHACDATLGDAPEITSVPAGAGNNIAFCADGAVYLSIDETQITAPGTLADLIWTRNNIEIARGVNNLVVTQEGKYDVWMGYIGCNRRLDNTVTVTRDGTGAPDPVKILVTGNNGMVCGPAGTTKLIAMNPNSAGTTMLWFKNGVQTTPLSSTPVTGGVEVETGIGNWFAVVQDGSCYSRPSDMVHVTEDPSSGTSLTPPEIEPIAGFCAGSSILLSVSSGAYNAAYTYTWYENNTQIGVGRSVMYAVPSGIQDIVIRCRATLSGSCALEALTVETITAGAIPDRPVITGDKVLCSGSATLNVSPRGSMVNPVYAWYKDNTLIGNTQQITVTSGGDYYATVTETGGCTSPMAKVTLPAASSAPPTVNFESSAPKPNHANEGDIITYRATITFGPALSYTWTTGNAAILRGGGVNDDYAVVQYGTAGSPAFVEVDVLNACGTGVGRREVPSVTANCEEADPMTLNPKTEQSKNAITGADFTLGPVSVSFGSSLTAYQWYRNTSKSTSGATLLAGKTVNSLVTQEAAAGTYYYYCVMSNQNNCGAAEVTSPFYTVTVSSNPATMNPGSGTFSGKLCFDINKSNWTGDCGTQASRTANATNFATLGSVAYTFTASASGTKQDLRFQVVDPEGCVASYSGGQAGAIANNAQIALTVNYKTDLSDDAGIIKGRTRDHAAEVMIYAIYHNGTAEVAIPLKVKIQDCVCCGAYVAAGQWKNFMCHNLGADESLDPFTPAKGLNGNYYQWGKKNVVATVNGLTGVWSDAQAPNGAWTDASKTANDPCPTGYRLPTYTQWTGVINAALNPQSAPAGATWATNVTNYNNGRFFGNALYLPAAGTCGSNGLNGTWSVRYWSSSTDDVISGWGVNHGSNFNQMGSFRRETGMSIRCVAE